MSSTRSSGFSQIQQETFENFLGEKFINDLGTVLLDQKLANLLSDNNPTVRHWRFFEDKWVRNKRLTLKSKYYVEFISGCTGITALELYQASAEFNRYDIRSFLEMEKEFQIFWLPRVPREKADSAPISFNLSEQKKIAQSLSDPEIQMITNAFGITLECVKERVANKEILNTQGGLAYSMLGILAQDRMKQDVWDELYASILSARENAKLKAEREANENNMGFWQFGGSSALFGIINDLKFLHNNMMRAIPFFGYHNQLDSIYNRDQIGNMYVDSMILLGTFAAKGIPYAQVRARIEEFRRMLSEEEQARVEKEQEYNTFLRQEEEKIRQMEISSNREKARSVAEKAYREREEEIRKLEQETRNRMQEDRVFGLQEIARSGGDTMDGIPKPNFDNTYYSPMSGQLVIGTSYSIGVVPPSVPPPAYPDYMQVGNNSRAPASISDLSSNNNSAPAVKRCNICGEDVDAVNIPCGHRYNCFKCSNLAKTCGFCGEGTSVYRLA